jgi:hypothetical protein
MDNKIGDSGPLGSTTPHFGDKDNQCFRISKIRRQYYFSYRELKKVEEG